MSIVQDALDWALAIAADDSHGYSQKRRFGPDYDCSSFVIAAYDHAFHNAGMKGPGDFGAVTTFNMLNAFKAAGFVEVAEELKAGDVCLNVNHHTEMFIGDGKLVGAHSSENGGIDGETGDQTGAEISVGAFYQFPWDFILRYPEEGEITLKLPRLPELRYGMTGNGVTAMQLLLMLRGFALPLWGADGDWGDETQNALEAFQKRTEITEDGICGPATWRALTEEEDGTE